MPAKILRSALAALAGSAALILASASFAETVNLKAELKGATEVPPTASKGSGAVTATYDTASKMLSWKGSYKDLTGPATMAHFHAGEAGKNGPVVIPISPSASPFAGSATLTDAQAAELLAGKWYVNVHTEANKGGEIRGQVTK
ncbi:MAG TPA: CHRD domain-containing protein [Xanthobacteraceae bacterium]|nr:CHRD domain-containing protein [Xanthobacteraceae bacterium]